MWPLVKSVTIFVPKSNVLPEGLVLTDFPGSGDSNKARNEIWKEVKIISLQYQRIIIIPVFDVVHYHVFETWERALQNLLQSELTVLTIYFVDETK